MSEENGKVCCNCRHNIRKSNETYVENCHSKNIECYCDIDNHFIGYIECMTGWCRRWSKDKEIKNEK